MAIVKDILKKMVKQQEYEKQLQIIRKRDADKIAETSNEEQKILAELKKLNDINGVNADMAEFEKFADVPIALTAVQICKRVPAATVDIGIDKKSTLFTSLNGQKDESVKYFPQINIKLDDMSILLKSMTENTDTADNFKRYTNNFDLMIHDGITARFINNYYSDLILLSGKNQSESRKFETSLDRDGYNETRLGLRSSSKEADARFKEFSKQVNCALYEAADKWAEQNKTKQTAQGQQTATEKLYCVECDFLRGRKSKDNEKNSKNT